MLGRDTHWWRMAIDEFGSVDPQLIYVALRWNDRTTDARRRRRMLEHVARTLSSLPRDRIKVRPEDVRVFNLVGPEPGRGMKLLPNELGEAERTLRTIARLATRSGRLQTIVVGGTSGLMPMVAVALKFLVPGCRIELRQHHKARKVTAHALALVRVIRG